MLHVPFEHPQGDPEADPFVSDFALLADKAKANRPRTYRCPHATIARSTRGKVHGWTPGSGVTAVASHWGVRPFIFGLLLVQRRGKENHAEGEGEDPPPKPPTRTCTRTRGRRAIDPDRDRDAPDGGVVMKPEQGGEGGHIMGSDSTHANANAYLDDDEAPFRPSGPGSGAGELERVANESGGRGRTADARPSALSLNHT